MLNYETTLSEAYLELSQILNLIIGISVKWKFQLKTWIIQYINATVVSVENIFRVFTYAQENTGPKKISLIKEEKTILKNFHTFLSKKISNW